MISEGRNHVSIATANFLYFTHSLADIGSEELAIFPE